MKKTLIVAMALVMAVIVGVPATAAPVTPDNVTKSEAYSIRAYDSDNDLGLTVYTDDNDPEILNVQISCGWSGGYPNYYAPFSVPASDLKLTGSTAILTVPSSDHSYEDPLVNLTFTFDNSNNNVPTSKLHEKNYHGFDHFKDFSKSNPAEATGTVFNYNFDTTDDYLDICDFVYSEKMSVDNGK